MNSFDQPQFRTRMFARVLGPFLVVVSITAAVRASEMPALISDLAANTWWSWIAGPFVLIGGLVMIALHPYWRGPAAITVSVLGWLVVLRGLLMLAFPTAFISMSESVIDMSGLWRAICIGFVALGLYLAYVGWLPTSRQAPPQSASAAPDLPRAA